MLSLDISRDSFQRPKNFSGMRWQQGRIPLESEMNEGVDIAAEELRRAIKDVICNSGTPDDGFRVSNPRVGTGGRLNFDIAAGSYYIGGVRYDMLGGSTFRRQPDWLPISIDLQPGPIAPDPGSAARVDFAYLEGWEQPCSATEDAELFERALAGCDGAGRLRRMARVHVVEDASANCSDALAAVLGDRVLDPSTCAVVTGAGLTVGFTDEGVEENLCAPQTQEGYLGAENETFRVQLTAPDRFIFGRDNAAPLYRVMLEAVDPSPDAPPGTPGQTRVTFLTQPRDAVSQPLAGHAVELFRWNTRLPNGEKLAEPIGTLANVAADYDPEDGTLLVDHELDPDWLAWFTGEGAGTGNPMDAEEDRFYFYLRVWTGGSGNADAPDHQITPGAIPLAATGLEVTFANALTPGSFGDPGEFWVIAARPNAPDVVTPWRLMDESAETPPPSPPMGPVRHLAPLALLSWAPVTGGSLEATAQDCRERFRKLCKIGSCCEITVGDGVRSFGDVNSIVEAVARLPLSGGKICLLRGHHIASVDLTDRSDIRFSGCGPETLWSADESQSALPAAVRLGNSHRISFSDFMMSAEAFDIARIGSRTGRSRLNQRCSEIEFRGIGMTARDASALWLNGCDALRVIDCTIVQAELSVPRTEDTEVGMDPAIFALGDDLHFEHNRILVSLDIPAERRPSGGIHLGGTTTGAVIRDNRIIGGKGDGITLGHIEWFGAGGGSLGVWTWRRTISVNNAGCLVPGFELIPPDSEDPTPPIPVSGGELRDLRIEGNQIADMGLNGIAVFHFFDLERQPDFIAVSDARIRDNRITGCLRTDLETPDPLLAFYSSVGGIALAACDQLEIDRNEIYGNAQSVTAPNTGIFILWSEGVTIRDNQIYDNGASPGNADALDPGRRGGVVIGWAITRAMAETGPNASAAPPRRTALDMYGNFIDSTHGRALKVTAFGPVHVCNNRLLGAAAIEPELALFGFILQLFPQITGLVGLITALAAQDPVERRDFGDASILFGEALIALLGGGSVSIFNLALLEELTGFFDDGPLEQSALAVGGETMFNDNQVGFRPHSAEANTHVSSVVVTSLDDVSVADNQIEVDTGFSFVLTNTLAIGTTVRVCGNRLQEQVFRTFFSGYSHGLLLNTTALNQGTHCFAVTTLFPLPGLTRVNENNMSLVDSFLGSFSDFTFCGLLDGLLQEFEADETDDDTGGGMTMFPGAVNYADVSSDGIAEARLGPGIGRFAFVPEALVLTNQ